jgi:uncharacterized membrane protein
MMDWSAGGWIMMSLGMLLFSALVILGIVWLVRALARDEREGFEHHEAAPERTPLEALNRSLAEGRIDVEDYRERRRELTGSP